MKKIIYLVLLIIMLIVVFPLWEVIQVINVLISNPEKDALDHFNSDDIGFVGVMNVALVLPGLDNYSDYEMVHKIMPYTSDFETNLISPLLNSISDEYAKRYNYRMYELIISDPERKSVISETGIKLYRE
jgi:hypothetical protein